ncbi:MAG: low molecular weight phosphotyrosine protein phosphatase [Clostridia bacterium]|nr:low molecular weight protein-tyrosine-phosphatase [Candidatus Pelethousia sp.]NCB30981.1 low molecular weight phosphotyrosine protein phosphatase [Clostridia bacterium]
MKRVLFVCHGNICRSPMAACVLRHLAREKGVEEDALRIDSAATSADELGSPIYPPARRTLEAHGVASDAHRATRLTAKDYDRYDYLLGMDGYNIGNMGRILGKDPQGKVHRLLDFTHNPRDIDDPWYTDDFETTFRDVSEGCEALLAQMGF